ncbi:MAG TPA: dihydrofolate reductase family protein [Anaerolineales bacterium]|nr:dihydrofolate reductase family protein [Anaerolineales bacterium]
MRDSITRLFPLPSQEFPLKGLYLSHNLRENKRDSGESFVYSNYVTSLDGRIAVPHPTKAGMVVPDQITNPRDWRLFQELAVQADILITSGRYLRDYAEGRAQEILRVYDDPQFADLKDWRTERGLSPQPDMAVISGSLDFPVPPALVQGDRNIIVITTSRADPERIKALESQAGKVIIAGEGSVNGYRLVESLLEMGYRTIYNATGPKVLHLLLAAGVLDRLYLSFVNRLLGGSPFSSIVEGGLLDPPADFVLNTIYLDPHALNGLGQLLTSYNRV